MFVAMVAAAVIALKATVLPMTAQQMARVRIITRMAALTGILCLESLERYFDPGRTPSLEIAYVIRCALMKQTAAQRRLSSQQKTRIATAPFGPTIWIQYSAHNDEYSAVMMPSKSCMQSKIRQSVGMDINHVQSVPVYMPRATTEDASFVSSEICTDASYP